MIFSVFKYLFVKYLLTTKRKSINLTVVKPDRHHLNQLIEVNIVSNKMMEPNITH